MTDVPPVMKAALIRELGAEPEIAEISVPTRSPGDCLVQIEAAALQPVELFIASGRFYDGPPQLPYVPGLEGVGRVVAGERLPTGAAVRVEIVHPGYGQDGCFAEYVIVPEAPAPESERSRSRVTAARSDLAPEVIAAVGSSGATAKLVLERAVARRGPIQGKHVLVLGATGVVGDILVQLCARAGAGRIVAVGRNRRRLERLRGLGADAVVEIGQLSLTELTDAFRTAAGGRVDVVFDPLWGEPAAAALDATSPGALHVSFGQSAGPRSPMSGVALRARGVELVGHSGARTSSEDLHRATTEVLDDAAAGLITVELERVPLSQLPDAWRRQAESPGTKLVIVPDGAT